MGGEPVRSVAFVLYVIDDLTNLPIARGQLRAHIPGMEPPVYKEGGWICFLDLPAGSYTAVVEGPAYQRQWVTAEVKGNAGEEGCPVITVRMMPGMSYRLPQNAVCLFGQALPGGCVRAFFKPEGNVIKLLYDYEKGKLIRIFSTEMKSLDGRSFCLDEKEFFTVLQTVDENERIYLMDRELSKPYKRGTASLCLAGRTAADKNGDFWLVSRCCGRGNIACTVDIPGSGLSPQTLTISPGAKIRVNIG